jgi:hypothetical protein
MSYFAVIREPGPTWNSAKSMRQQDGWQEHAAFMNGLAEDGFVVLGGPLGDGRRVLLAVEAASEAELRRRLEDDPWTPMNLLPITSVEPWQVLLRSPPR